MTPDILHSMYTSIHTFANAEYIMHISFIGERERANLVVRSVRFFGIMYVCIMFLYNRHCPPHLRMRHVLRNSKYPNCTEISRNSLGLGQRQGGWDMVLRAYALTGSSHDIVYALYTHSSSHISRTLCMYLDCRTL